MADHSKIEWCEATWNPVVGCTKVSAGCDHCYAETLVNRFAGKNPAFPNRFDVVTMRDARVLTQPVRWKRPRRIFVNSLSDLFHDDVPADFIAQVFAVMAVTPQHTYQLLTKRHARMRALLRDEKFWQAVLHWVMHSRRHVPGVVIKDATYLHVDGGGLVQVTRPLANLWLGVSVEDQHWADIRIPALLDTPAAVRWLSCEPLLGPLDLAGFLPRSVDAPWYPVECRHGFDYCPQCDGPRAPEDAVQWIVAGGESGPQHRPLDLDWVRQIRDQCRTAGVPFLFKQVGGRTSKAGGRDLDGRTWDEYPSTSLVHTV